jgi:hypothetical protein
MTVEQVTNRVDAALRSDTDVESEAVSLRSINLQVSKAHQFGSHSATDHRTTTPRSPRMAAMRAAPPSSLR